MRMLTAQTLPAAGEITVLGYRLPDQSKQARMEMGVVPQLDNLHIELTCRQILTVFARLYRVPRHARPAPAAPAAHAPHTRPPPRHRPARRPPLPRSASRAPGRGRAGARDRQPRPAR